MLALYFIGITDPPTHFQETEAAGKILPRTLKPWDTGQSKDSAVSRPSAAPRPKALGNARFRLLFTKNILPTRYHKEQERFR